MTSCSHFIIIATWVMSVASGNPIVKSMWIPPIKAIAEISQAATTGRDANAFVILVLDKDGKVRIWHIFLKVLLDSPGWCFTHVQQTDGSEDNKSWWRIQQVPFYTFGYPSMMSRPHEPIGLELFYTCFGYRSCRQRFPKVSTRTQLWAP